MVLLDSTALVAVQMRPPMPGVRLGPCTLIESYRGGGHGFWWRGGPSVGSCRGQGARGGLLKSGSKGLGGCPRAMGKGGWDSRPRVVDGVESRVESEAWESGVSRSTGCCEGMGLTRGNVFCREWWPGGGGSQRMAHRRSRAGAAPLIPLVLARGVSVRCHPALVCPGDRVA